MIQGRQKAQKQSHVAVLLKEAVQALNINKSGFYIDTTYGRGGHTQSILNRLGKDGCLVAMDRDGQAIEHATQTLGDDPRCHIVRSNLGDIDTAIAALALDRSASGVLADLGVSSPQLEDARRGFSFNVDGPLDMRMDTNSELDAATWLNRVEEKELTEVLQEYGEERYAKRIANAVIQQRRTQPVTRTKQLADIVCDAIPTREKNKHPATRTFQAIRMRINAELDQLSTFLPKAVQLLAAGGRLVIISFHSLEDRLVKRFLREQARGDDYPVEVPVRETQTRPLLKLVGKPCRPTTQEIESNPRARSAILRVAERTEYCHA